jgi:hypothetical protein
MKQLNSVIVEGDFQHFTSKKGAIPLSFIVNCNGEHFTISVNNSKMSEMIIKTKPSGMRVVGSLVKIGRSVGINAEHIELKPKTKKTAKELPAGLSHN